MILLQPKTLLAVESGVSCLPLDDLFRGPAEEFGHGQVELRGQPLKLLVSRVGQLHFGSFHMGNLPHAVSFVQGQVP